MYYVLMRLVITKVHEEVAPGKALGSGISRETRSIEQMSWNRPEFVAAIKKVVAQTLSQERP